MKERERAFSEKVKNILNGVTIEDTTYFKTLKGIPKEYIRDINNTVAGIRRNNNNFGRLINDVLLLCTQLGWIQKYDTAEGGNKSIDALISELHNAVSEKITGLESKLRKTETDLNSEKSNHEKSKNDRKTRDDQLSDAKTQEAAQKLELARKDAEIKVLTENVTTAIRDVERHKGIVTINHDTAVENQKYKNILRALEDVLLVNPIDKVECKFENAPEGEMLYVANGLKIHLAQNPFNAADFMREARKRYTVPGIRFFTAPTLQIEELESSPPRLASGSKPKLLTLVNKRRRDDEDHDTTKLKVQRRSNK